MSNASDILQRLFGSSDLTPGDYVIVSADGELFENRDTLAEAQAIADAWNADTRPTERTHEGAYPFRACHRDEVGS